MVRNMILLVHDRMRPRTHPVTHQKVSRIFEKALNIFATIVTLKTVVQWCVSNIHPLISKTITDIKRKEMTRGTTITT